MLLRAERGYEALIWYIFARVPSAAEGHFSRAVSLFDPVADANIDARFNGLFRELDADIEVLAALAARFSEPYFALHLVKLHEKLDECATSAVMELEEVTKGKKCDKALAKASRDFVDLVRAHAGLLSPTWRKVYATALFPELDFARNALLPLASELTQHLPKTQDQEVVLVHALGSRARVIDGTIYVGAPLPWNGMSRERTLALIVHEVFVMAAHRASGTPASNEQGWQRVERIAIDAATQLLAGSSLGHAYEHLREHWNEEGIARSEDVSKEVAVVIRDLCPPN